MAIPRKIHQIWVGPNPIPNEVEPYCEKTRSMNPDFAYELHGNELLTRYESDPYVRHMVNNGEKWAFIVDRLRVLLLRDEGGFYIDSDARPIQPISTLPIWNMDHVDFVAGFRDPYRPGVALHRGISLVDNTCLASMPNGRIANRLVNLYNSKSPKRDGHDIGCEILANSREDVVWLNFRYVYGMQRHPESVFLHDDANLGSWTTNRPLQFADQ